MNLLPTPPKFDFENHPFVIAVVGSREFKRERWVHTFLDQLRDGTLVVSGGAPEGVDLWVKEDIRDKHAGRLIYKEFSVLSKEWELYGKPAGPIRNESIVFYMKMLMSRGYGGHTVIFANYNVRNQMYTPGSNSVILLAKKYQVPHTVYHVEV